MKKLLTVTAILICLKAAAQENNVLTETERGQGWKLLFDGISTDGWHSFKKEKAGAAWVVKDGVLFLDTTNKAGWQIADGGDLTSDKAYSQFHLKLDWKIARGGNSGIIFFVQEKDKYDHSWLTGPEMQIVDNVGHADGNLVKHQAGDLYDLIACSKKVVKPAGEWNTAEIIAEGGGLALLLNGVKVVSTTMWGDSWNKMVAGSKFKDMPDFGKFKSGKIALQDHGDMVSFRNIKIKELK